MITMVIHGGAGAISRDRYSTEEIKNFEKGLENSLHAGYSQLEKGGSALDAVSAAVVAMEDSPIFNAGRGSVLTADGRIQMDAAIMCGQSARCGAVTLIEKIKNPILAARYVMEKTPHRLLGGKDAEEFAKLHGLPLMDLEYFKTDLRLNQLREAQKSNSIQLDHDGAVKSVAADSHKIKDDSNTVGAVALDQEGNLAAATSTGGMTNKLPGRVSDTSIIGAGTFADNSTLAFSATGTGDVFIQNVSAFDAHALMQYRNYNLQKACQEVLDKVQMRKGEGGVIAVNAKGESFLGFNSSGMFRGMKNSKGEMKVEIF